MAHLGLFNIDDIADVDNGNLVFGPENGENEVIIAILKRGIA